MDRPEIGDREGERNAAGAKIQATKPEEEGEKQENSLQICCPYFIRLTKKKTYVDCCDEKEGEGCETGCQSPVQLVALLAAARAIVVMHPT